MQLFTIISILLLTVNSLFAANLSVVPFLKLAPKNKLNISAKTGENLKFIPFAMLLDRGTDTSEFWLMTDILSLVKKAEEDIDYEACDQAGPSDSIVRIPSRRTVRPICRSRIDFQLCPQCPHFDNRTECELYQDSCRERRVLPHEYRSYCDKRYGKWRTMFVPADYSQCRCCDECIFYRELDQSCVHDEFHFEADETLPVTTIDFRAGCNPYLGHPDQELKALRCETNLRRCVPVSVSTYPKEALRLSHAYRYEPPSAGMECHGGCRGYPCPTGLVREPNCTLGAFLPHRDYCNCCGKCSGYFQLNQKCAEFKQTVHYVNGSMEIEVEEEFIEPGCDVGLVCRQGRCKDIHAVDAVFKRTKRDHGDESNEPCKQELKYFKKKYGPHGHLHYEAPQCTPLWLYAPVQCRRFVCYCALEDGTFIEGIKVPRVDVSNMNCDCAREKCRTGAEVECDAYGNYKTAVFTRHIDEFIGDKEKEHTTEKD